MSSSRWLQKASLCCPYAVALFVVSGSGDGSCHVWRALVSVPEPVSKFTHEILFGEFRSWFSLELEEKFL